MDYLVKGLLQANIDSLDRAIASDRLIRVLIQYGDLVEFVLLYEIDDDPAYEALARAFDWLRDRIGFNVAPPVQARANLPNPHLEDYGSD